MHWDVEESRGSVFFRKLGDFAVSEEKAVSLVGGWKAAAQW